MKMVYGQFVIMLGIEHKKCYCQKLWYEYFLSSG